MKARVWLGGFLVMVCLTTLWGVWSQRCQLAGLRGQQQQLLAQVTTRADGSASPAAGETSARPGTPAPALVATPELLRLRSEVTRLTERRRELAGERAENERLRGQLASRGTIGPAAFQLPPGYIRKSEARLVGYNAPDDTLQSLLWAFQNHDLTNVLQAFSPELAEKALAELARSDRPIEELFAQGTSFPGVRIVKREPDASNGAMTVEVEVVPGEPGPRLTFRQTNGQWKIAGPF